MTDTFTSTSATSVSSGAVSSTSSLAIDVASRILSDGGNAVDAAVAGALMALVTNPERAGFGGNAVVMCAQGMGQVPTVVCGQGAAPARATREHFVEHVDELAIPTNGSVSASVPGTMGALMNTLKKWGTLPPAQVFRPAIQAALDGVELSPAADAMQESRERILETEWTSTLDAMTIETASTGKRVVKQPVLGKFLSDMVSAAKSADQGAACDLVMDAWYRGEVAEKIAGFCEHYDVLDETGQRHRGLITMDDMASFQPVTKPAVQVLGGQSAVYTTGVWTMGTALAETLAIVQGAWSPPADGDSLADRSSTHMLIEAAKLSAADAFFYGDPKSLGERESQQFLDDDYVESRRSCIDPEFASMEFMQGNMPGRQAVRGAPVTYQEVSERSRQAKLLTYNAPTKNTSGSAVTVADGSGMVVTIEMVDGTLAEAPCVPGLGFPLNAALSRCTLTPGAANEVRGGVRPTTPVAPVIIQRGEDSLAGIASVGGSRKSFTVLAALMRLMFANTMRDAARHLAQRPAAQLLHGPLVCESHEVHLGKWLYEESFDPIVAKELRSMGHRVNKVPVGSLGGLVGVLISPGELSAFSDGRAHGSRTRTV